MAPEKNTPTLFTITQTGGNPVVAAEHRLDGPFYSWDADPKDPNVDSKISDAVNYPGKLTLTFKGAPKDNKYTRTGTITWHDIPPGAASPQEIKLTATLTLYTLKSVLIPDFNHDRVIEDADRDNLYPAQDSVTPEPFRFWINDDADDGDVAPGDENWHLPLGDGKGNTADKKVNGRSDLVDFFPILVDIKDALAIFPCDQQGVEYRLKQADGAVNIVYTSLKAAEAGNFLIKDEATGYGANLDKAAYEAETVTVTSDGLQLPQKFLQQIAADGGKGILLVEGKKATTEPLVLEIKKDGQPVYSKAMPLSLSSVEDMYRWANLRMVAGGSAKKYTNDSEPPNYPDSICNGKMLYFVHGYNVKEKEARATAAEVFKRFYQSGCRSMFTAIAWYGSQSRNQVIKGTTLDFYSNSTNAFYTAQALAEYVKLHPSQEKHMVAHSLVNMLVSSAIVDCQMNINGYFMMDAAVPMEAYGNITETAISMCNSEWMSGYTSKYKTKTWASFWFDLFTVNDNRRSLTWCSRFINISNMEQLKTYNYYSSGEDVLSNTPLAFPDIESIWVFQELHKGTLWMAGPGNMQGGGGDLISITVQHGMLELFLMLCLLIKQMR